MTEKAKKLTITLLSFCLITTIGSFAGGDFLLKTALLTTKGKDMPTSKTFICAKYPYLKTWLEQAEAKGYLCDTCIINHKGKRLVGKYIAAEKQTNQTAIVIHGYTDNAYRIMHIGHMYNHDLGYNVLIPNLQYHGESEGEAIQMGWNDRLDILEWMDFANRLFGGNTEMVIHGISMGAATVMNVSGETLAPYVKCFIEDCGYTSVWDQFAKELKEDFGLPTFPLLYAADALCSIKYGWRFCEASSLEQVKKSKLPMFFIHGTEDRYVPTWMVQPLFEAKRGEKELWLVEKARHAVAFKENRTEYIRRVKAFTDRYIKKQQP